MPSWTVRVLHLIKGLGPGGAERLLVSLAEARSSRIELHVAYVLSHKDHLVRELETVGAQVHLLGRGLGDVRWPVRFRTLIGGLQPDIVHLHSPAIAAVATPILRTVRHRPVVVTTEHNMWASFGRLTRLANTLVLPLADARLAVSDEVRASVHPRLQPSVDLLVQGIPVARLQARRSERTRSRASLGLGEDDVLVATVANFREKKDYPTLLRAAAACRDHPALRFVSIGQGPLEDAMHRLHEELGVGERFAFLGYHPDPPAVVAGADIFVLSSRHEGLPIALLEAMALGVAPVATRVGGIPEVVTDGADGVLVPPGDHGALATALRDLAVDHDRRRALAIAARRRAADFDIAETQRSLEALYARLLERR